MIELKTNYSLEDIKNAYNLYYKLIGVYHYFYWIITVELLIYFTYSFHLKGFFDAFTMVSFILLIAFSFLAIYRETIMPKSLLRNLTKENGGVYNLSFKEKEIRVWNKTADTNFKWGIYDYIAENNETFLLFWKNKAPRFHIVPKRFFKTKAELKYFSDLIKEKVKGGIPKKPKKRAIMQIFAILIFALNIILLFRKFY